MTRGLFLSSQPEALSTGGGQVTSGRLASLRALGFELDVLRLRTARFDSEPAPAPAPAPAAEAREQVPRDRFRRARVLAQRALVHGYPARFDGRVWARLRGAAKRARFVFLDGLYTAEYGRELKRDGFDRPVILHEHNVEHALLARRRRLGKARGSVVELLLRERRFRWIESRLGRYADLCLALTSEDTELLRALNPGFPVRTLPHPVDLARYAPLPGKREQDELLFIGSFHWPANVDSLRWFSREIWPLLRKARPQLRLTVVGRDPPQWAQKLGDGVTVEGFVEDERPFFARACALVVPLRYGGGMRVKILNAWALKTPLVSTRIGAEGLPARDGESLLQADDAQGFARQVLRLVEDPALGRRLADEGRRICEAQFGAASVGEALGLALAELGVRP